MMSEGLRTGRKIVIKSVNRKSPAVIRKARESTLAVRGAQVFNLLPDNIRTMNSEHVDFFKNHLDIFLSNIPDQPTMTGLGRAADSNNLLHQLPLYYVCWVDSRLTVKLEDYCP